MDNKNPHSMEMERFKKSSNAKDWLMVWLFFFVGALAGASVMGLTLVRIFSR